MSIVTTSCPFVYWAQDADNLHLTVDLQDALDVEASVQKNEFSFKAIGSGAQGRQPYFFKLPLFSNVEIKEWPNKSESSLHFVLKKKKSCWWPSATKDRKRFSWLRVDFNRFKDPDESDSSAEGAELVDPLKKSYERGLDEMARRVLNSNNIIHPSAAPRILGELQNAAKGILKYYMIGYNISMFLIHFYVLSYLLSYYVLYGTGFLATFWSDKSSLIKFATRLQLFEVIHSIAGITKTGTVAALVQVLGRLTMLNVIDGYQLLHSLTSTFSLIVVYFLIEMFRKVPYPYYTVTCLGKEYKATTWLRYNMWIPLYPAGFILEGVLITAVTLFRAIPYYYHNSVFNIKMPNAANISFNFGVFLTFLLLILPVIGTYLLYYMFRQRRRKFVTLRKKIL